MKLIFLVLICLPCSVFSTLADTKSWIPEIFNGNPGLVNSLSCVNSCGGSKKGICFCDAKCELLGDCCFDYWKECTTSEFRNEDIVNTVFYFNSRIFQTKEKYGSPISILHRSDNDAHYCVALDTKTQTTCSLPVVNLNSNACGTSKVTMEGATAEKLLVSYINKVDNTIYKNFYCGKCNGVSDENLVKMNYTKYCESRVESMISSPSDVTLEFARNSSNVCRLLYDKPNAVDAVLRFEDQVKGSWIGAKFDASGYSVFTGTVDMFRNPSIAYGAYFLDPALCGIYILPVTVSNEQLIGTTIFSSGITFNNIHCLKYFLSSINFGLNEFEVDNSSARSLLRMEKPGHLSINIELENTVDYTPEGDQYKQVLLRDADELLTRFNSQALVLESQDTPVFETKQLFSELDVTVGDQLDSYLSMQIHDPVPSNSSIISVYNFTLVFEATLDTGLLMSVFDLMEVFSVQPVFTPLYERAVKSFFADVIVRRFKLANLMPSNYTISVNQTSFGYATAKLFIPLQFQVRNLETLGRITASLWQIMNDAIKLQYFTIFEVTLSPTLNKIDLYNFLIEDPTAEYFLETMYCFINPVNENIDILTLVNSEKTSFHFDILSKYAHRINSVNKLMPYNFDPITYTLDDSYSKIYRYKVKRTSNEMTITFCLAETHFSEIFVSYENKNDMNANDMKLFYLEDWNSMAKFNDLEFTLAYKSNGTKHELKIDKAKVTMYGNQLYFFCLQKDDSVVGKLEAANDVFASSVSFEILQANSVAGKPTGFTALILGLVIFKWSTSFWHYN